MIRQAHPGPGVRPYREMEEKTADAQRHRAEEGIPWPVLVDNIEGTVHQAYGRLADPTYLIDMDGRIAFYSMWTHAPNLNRAIRALFRQDGRGVVNGGIDHLIHPFPLLTDGWTGIRRGLPQSFVELETAVPGTASSLWVGHQLRPILAPLTLRDEPLSAAGRAAVGLGMAATAFLAKGALRR